MNVMRHPRLAALMLGCVSATALAAEPTATIVVDVGHPGPAIGPMMYGLMTEEINHAYDGGLYAELIQNRCFKDDPKQPAHWTSWSGSKISLDTSDPVNPALGTSLKVDVQGTADISNDGYWGIPAKPDTVYTASFYAKGTDGFSAPLRVAIMSGLRDGSGEPLASAMTPPVTGAWQKITVTLKTGPGIVPSKYNHFAIRAQGRGTLRLSDVSLFPPTFNNRPNGDRIDITEKLAAMHPAFIRLPGGNYLEGDNFPNRFDWKKMIGPVDHRPGHMGCWSYRSSDGFGLPEFLNWCDDVHAEPLLAVFAGYTLNHDQVLAGPKLQPYVDEALEEIEYLTGDEKTRWGKQRIADGHPAPMKLHYVEVGNEDFFDGTKGGYDGRFAQFFDAIRAKYPDLKIIATAPVKSRKADLIDDHYYRSARQMAFDGGHYDKADRNGSHIFVGEWATQEGKPTPDLNAGLADAAWLMGLENDADVVDMTCYAPLLVNVNPGAWQWPTNLIGYDNLTSFGSPSYWAQVMINQNRGDYVLPTRTTVDQTKTGAAPAPHGRIGVGTWHTDAEFQGMKMTPGDGAGSKPLLATQLTAGSKNWSFAGGKWAVTGESLQSGSVQTTTWATIGDPLWTDYTVTLKARKISGEEGFLILFHAVDSGNFLWWNVGGWGNTRTQFEATYDDARGPFGPASNFKIETGKWYDIKVEVKGHHFRGYVDGKLVSEADENPIEVRTPFFAESSYIKSSGEVVLKVVNMSADPITANIQLNGAEVAPTGKAIVLTSASAKDQNTVAEPTKVAPHGEPITGVGPSFYRTFPAYSFTLMRIAAKAN
jgi:alpha-L-arabinofuranosidase